MSGGFLITLSFDHCVDASYGAVQMPGTCLFSLGILMWNGGSGACLCVCELTVHATTDEE